jgi:hypothetical protein
MGMDRDKNRRNTERRTDDQARRDLIKQARDRIYEGKYAVGCDEVEDMLQPNSWVPIAVSTVTRINFETT